MSTLHKVVIPVGETVTFSFEIDGKKVEADASSFLDTAIVEPKLKAEGAQLNSGRFTAPARPGIYDKLHTYQIPGVTANGHDENVKHPTAIGLFYLRFESKQGAYGSKGNSLTCRLLMNGNAVENDPALLPDKGPFEHINGFKYDNTPAAPAPPIRHLLVSGWSVTDHPTPGVLTYKADMPSSDKGEVTFKPPAIPPPATPGGTSPVPVQPTISISVNVLVQLQIPWPKDFPQFVQDKPDDIAWKSDHNGSFALGNFYALFPLLPEDFKKDVGNVPIRRRALCDKGGHMDQYFWEIVIDDGSIKTNWPQTISHHFVHEMAHTSNFQKTSAAWGQMIPGLATWLLELSSLTAAATAGALIVSGVATVGWTFIIILAAAELATAYFATKKDFISDWSVASQWQCNHFGWHVIPVIGHLIGAFHKTEPNMFFAFPSRKDCAPIAAYFGLENRLLTEKSSWREAEFVSDYATNNPLEDFADSFASLVLTENMLRMARGVTPVAGTFPNPPPAPPTPPTPVPPTPVPAPPTPTVMNRLKTMGERANFLKKTFFKGGSVAELDHYLAVQYEEVDFDISQSNKTVSAKAASAAGKAHADYLKVLSMVQQMQQEWENGAGPLFERNKEIIGNLAIPIRQNPTPFELLRAFELHGDGWKAYEGKEQPVTKGDFVADAAQQTWMITTTDEQERLQQVSGGFTYKKGMKADDLIKEHTFFKLTWSPSSEKRNWLPNGQKASAYYTDLDGVFTHMVRLWGEHTAPESGLKLDSFKGFLQEWLLKAGMWNDDYPFENDQAGLQEVLNYLESHGEGLQVFDPLTVKAAPGDLLIPYHASAFALITRIDEEKQCADVLESGTFENGPLGEPADVARMRHHVPLADFQYYWTPSPKTRTLI